MQRITLTIHGSFTYNNKGGGWLPSKSIIMESVNSQAGARPAASQQASDLAGSVGTQSGSVEVETKTKE